MLGGDFNTPWSWLAVPRWIRKHLADAAASCGGPKPTFPCSFPVLRLDRVFVGPKVRVVACDVLDGALVKLASDHRPIVLELEVEVGARRPPQARTIEAEGVTTSTAR